MVLPIIVGIGVTVAALTVKATINTVTRCRRLTPMDIARLNGLFSHPSTNKFKVWPKDTPYWRRFHELDSEMPYGGFDGKMTRDEAMEILGFEKNELMKRSITWDEIRKRHRKLMMGNHPDKGGSKYIAMKINMAKQILEQDYK